MATKVGAFKKAGEAQCIELVEEDNFSKFSISKTGVFKCNELIENTSGKISIGKNGKFQCVELIEKNFE